MRFNQLINLLLESLYRVKSTPTRWKDLPLEKPYGFWIDLEGNLYLVPFMSHNELAERVLLRLKIPRDERWAVEQLMDMHWLRVLIEDDTLYHGPPHTRKQNSAIQDLEIIYDLTAERDEA